MFSLSYWQYPFLANVFDIWRDILFVFQIFVAGYYLISSKNYKKFLQYFLVLIVGISVASLIKLAFPTLRPISLYFSEKIYYDSFPSRHTMTSTILSFLLIFDNLKIGILSFALTILIAIFSYLSLMHRFIDIAVGFLLGFLIVFIFKKLDYIFSKPLMFIKEKRNSK